MPRAQPGQRFGGRTKGTPNKVTSDVRQAILNAFTEVGGEKYLVVVARENPTVFCTLLGKILPTQLEHSGEIGLAGLVVQSIKKSETHEPA